MSDRTIENYRMFLDSPEGMELVADAVRRTRRLLSADSDPEFLTELAIFESELRAASARPLPPELTE